MGLDTSGKGCYIFDEERKLFQDCQQYVFLSKSSKGRGRGVRQDVSDYRGLGRDMGAALTSHLSRPFASDPKRKDRLPL